MPLNETTAREILERLTAIETTQDRVVADVSAIRYAIDGNGTPGLKIRIDRIEQREARRERAVWVAVTAAVGAVGMAVVRMIFG
jgi:hypothetical protein